MFENTPVFDSDISGWDVSSVTNMESMFNMDFKFLDTVFNGDISSWDVSSVQNMAFMFFKAALFNNDISSWDVSAVTSMRRLFYNANQFGQKLCEWNIGEGTEVSDMFWESKCTVAECVECPTSSPSTLTPAPTTTPPPCSKKSLVLTNDNKSNILSDNSSDETIVGCFDTSQVTNMDSFLKGRDTFNADLSSWDVSSVTSMQVSCC